MTQQFLLQSFLTFMLLFLYHLLTVNHHLVCNLVLIFFLCLFFPVKYRNRQGHAISYCIHRQRKKLLVDGYPFSRDTMKGGWVYWRCVGYRKTGFVRNHFTFGSFGQYSSILLIVL